MLTYGYDSNGTFVSVGPSLIGAKRVATKHNQETVYACDTIKSPNTWEAAKKIGKVWHKTNYGIWRGQTIIHWSKK